MPSTLRAGVLLACCVAVRADDIQTMIKDVQAIVDHSAVKYNCSFSVAVKAPKLPSTLTWAAGGATTDSKFAWGSITKMWTGASIMQLVASGALTLDTPAAPIVDAQLAAMKKINFPGLNFTTLAELYGPDVGKVTIHNLLAMQSGIPDFDTANPSRIPGGKDKDSFRASVYANPNQDFLEPALMSVPWVALGKLESTPGTGFHYSSTNFGILGLILAHFAQEDDYRYFNQSSFLQAVPALAALRSQIDWGVRGSPADLGVINGFDRTDYNGQDPKAHPAGVAVGAVHGVFAGWSASDFAGTPAAVAEVGHSLWGKASALVPQQYRDLMVPNLTTHNFMDAFYGLASQNVGLMGITGGATGSPYAVAYGHLGATYGYDSIFAYNPTLDLGIAVASNIETLLQTQPSDTFCGVFNRVKNFMNQEPIETCTYTTGSFYGGKCTCK